MMGAIESIKLTANDGLELSTVLFRAEDPKALVQIIHGAVEHKNRYFDFAKYLQKNGFTVIISDNRGHGESRNDEYYLGTMGSLEQMIDDQVLITKYIQGLYPGKGLYMIGHSLGSLFARVYLQEHDHELSKLVLSGTPNYVVGVKAAYIFGKVVTKLGGRRGYILSRIKGDTKQDFSWISVSEKNLESYINDPLCGYIYENYGQLTVIDADRQMHNFKAFKCANPDLPILSVTGEDDPVTGGSKGIRDSILSLRKVGYKNISSIVYKGMKHEVLNEDDKEKVYNDVLEFLLK
ncbi:MAG: alpha/beta fold hydrolase [Eubacteriales bacterium]|jgi:alpha-beta hydrolase superfamily lysophospholipase